MDVTALTWWQLSEDEDEFLDFVDKTGDVVATGASFVHDKSWLVPTSVLGYLLDHERETFLFGLKEQVLGHEVAERIIDGKRMYMASLGAGYVIYDPYRVEDGFVRLSNLCVYWSLPSEDHSTTFVKDAEFRRWANKLFDYLRKHTREKVNLRGFPYRATKRVAAAVREGRVAVEL